MSKLLGFFFLAVGLMIVGVMGVNLFFLAANMKLNICGLFCFALGLAFGIFLMKVGIAGISGDSFSMGGYLRDLKRRRYPQAAPPITFQCPGCGRIYHGPATLAGQNFECRTRTCARQFVVQAQNSAQ